MEETQATHKQHEVELKIKSFLNNMPSSYIQQQCTADTVQEQALISQMSELKHTFLSPHTPHSQALEFYIPLKGGPQTLILTNISKHPPRFHPSLKKARMAPLC
jgi:hypothetical protein